MPGFSQKFKIPRELDDLDPFDAATRFDTLWIGWQKVRANQGAMGGDGVTIAAFEADAANRVSRLAHALRNNLYRPRDSRRVNIAKKSGGMRTLLIPSITDRVAQAAVALVLGPRLDKLMEPSSFAYRPGRSVADAIHRIAVLRRAGYVHVVDGDIVRYFDNIPHEPLLDLLDRHVRSPRLIDLIALWLEDSAPDGVGVAQGSPLSPLLANLYLDDIDEKIEGRGVRLVRYADDFVILCKSAALADNALGEMRRLLGEAGLELHRDKTRLVDFDQGFRFLGHLMVKSLVLKEFEVDETPSEEILAASAALLAKEAAEVEPRKAGEADAPRGRWSPRRRVLYVIEPGRRLAADGPHFLVLEAEGVALDLPAARVDRIELGPGVEASAAALDLAAATDTTVLRIDGRGRAVGQWTGLDAGRVKRHLRQAAAVLDEDRRARLARAFVAGKVFNQRTLLKRIDRRRGHPDVDVASVRLNRIFRKVDRLNMTVAQAMGHEGEAAAVYWPMLEKLLDLPWAFAGRRKRRIGFDPFNAVVDVLSSLLLRECRDALMRAGLHPGYSFLHAPEDHEWALAYDLAEEFRPPLVEAVAMSLFKRRALTETSFRETPNGIRLAPDGFNAAVRGFEKQMARSIRDPQGGDELLWRGLVDEQAERLGDAIEVDGSYLPYRMDY